MMSSATHARLPAAAIKRTIIAYVRKVTNHSRLGAVQRGMLR